MKHELQAHPNAPSLKFKDHTKALPEGKGSKYFQI